MKPSKSTIKLWNHRKLMITEKLKPLRQSKMYREGCGTVRNKKNKNPYNTKI